MTTPSPDNTIKIIKTTRLAGIVSEKGRTGGNRVGDAGKKINTKVVTTETSRPRLECSTVGRGLPHTGPTQV